MTRTLMMVLAGAVFGGGLFGAIRGLFPASLPLQEAYNRLHEPKRPTPVVSRRDRSDAYSSLEDRFGPPALNALSRVGVDLSSRSADLRIVGMSPTQLAFRKLVGLSCGALLPIALTALAARTGFSVAPLWTMVMSVVGAALGFLWPDKELIDRASEARVDFDAAFTAYLELVRTLIAGGMNVHGALQVAAAAGEGPAFDELVDALDRATMQGTTIATEFDRLATDADLPELSYVASSLELAAEQGASPGDALSSRAQTLTDRRIYAERDAAEQATAQMSIPTALLALAFVLLLGAPALAAVLASTAAATGP